MFSLKFLSNPTQKIHHGMSQHLPVTRHQSFVIFVTLFFLICIFKVPSLFEPHWHPDEGIYSAIASQLDQGDTLYIDTWDHKPPLIFYTYLVVYKIFGYNLFYIKLLVLIITLVSTLLFYKNFKTLFKNISPIVPTIAFIFFFSTPLIDGNVANAENFFILFSMLGLFLALRFIETKKRLYLFLFGLVFGIGCLYKIHPLFEFIAIFVFLNFIYTKKDSLKNTLLTFTKPEFYLPIFGILIPIVSHLLIFILQGNIVGYLETYTVQVNTYIISKNINLENLIQVFQTLPFKTIVLLISVIAILFWFYKKSYDSEKKAVGNVSYDVLVSLLFIFTLYAVLLSGKEYAHYLLQLIPHLIFLITLVGLKFRQSVGIRYAKPLRIGLALLIIVITIFAFFGQNILTGKGNGADISANSYFNYLLNYYPNFIKYATGNLTEAEYQDQFYSKPSKLYELVNATKYAEHKNTFIIADQPWYYFLTRSKDSSPYVVAFHLDLKKINAEEYIKKLSEKTEYFIIDKDYQERYPIVVKYLEENYLLKDQVGDFRVFEK
jgi:4-amino-4-deoxy-L-arabinose transferase-like glycosyltransferase